MKNDQQNDLEVCIWRIPSREVDVRYFRFNAFIKITIISHHHKGKWESQRAHKHTSVFLIRGFCGGFNHGKFFWHEK